MKSPFKFLDAFELKDNNVFFGRKEETDELYNMVFKTPLLLVYGISGTGKTSLIQCGLAGRFTGPNWLPLFIRRTDNINAAIQRAFAPVIPEDMPAPENLKDTVSLLFRYYLRPVYLIFDQLEELFILGNQEEQETFARSIRELLSAELPCKIILVMREEFIGQLYHLEKEIPSIYDFRLRVEPMGFKKVKEVITNSFNAFNITLEDAGQNIKHIYRKISAGKSGVQLPYLQVYFDMLWREDYDRAQGAGAPIHPGKEAAGENIPALKLTTAEIEAFGAIEDVLARFLRQQEQILQTDLGKNHADMPAHAVRRLLGIFVTEEGTKRPVKFFRADGIIRLEEKAARFLPYLPPEAQDFALERLISARLLRERDNNILELAHDSLAALIDQERSDEDRKLNEIIHRLQNAFREHQLSQGTEYPSKKLLLDVEENIHALQLTPEMTDFYRKSRAEMEQRENTERMQAEQRARDAEEKTAQQIKLRQMAVKVRNIALLFSAISFILCAAAIVFYTERQQTSKALQQTSDALEKEKSGRLMAESIARHEKQSYYASKFIKDNQERINDMQQEDAYNNIIKIFVYHENKGNDEKTISYDSINFRPDIRPFVDNEISRQQIAGLLFELAFYFRETEAPDSKKLLIRDLTGFLGFSYNLFMKNYNNELVFLLNRDSSEQESFEETCFSTVVKKYFPDMALLPGGTFEKGTDIPCPDCEPRTFVSVDSLYIGKTEVTNHQYNLYLKAHGKSIFEENAYRGTINGNCPVVKVDWFNALSYCNWLNERLKLKKCYSIRKESPVQYSVFTEEKNGFRLPTENEWEYAARANSNFAFSGNDTIETVGWYKQNSGNAVRPVASLKANGFGLYDMCGNAAEWCWDWNKASSSDTLTNKKRRVFRGGSYYFDAEDCRVFSRFVSYERNNYATGFRIVRNYSP